MILHLIVWWVSHAQEQKPEGLRVVCFFYSLGFKGRKFRSESYAQQIHGGVRGRRSRGFKNITSLRFAVVLGTESSESRDGIWHVEFTRQPQVSARVYGSKQSTGEEITGDADLDERRRRRWNSRVIPVILQINKVTCWTRRKWVLWFMGDDASPLPPTVQKWKKMILDTKSLL